MNGVYQHVITYNPCFCVIRHNIANICVTQLSLDSRTDLPKVRYATALDWFLLMSFFYCIATLLEFAGVHFFTKVGSGEIPATLNDYDDDYLEEDPDEYVPKMQAHVVSAAEAAAAADAADWEDVLDAADGGDGLTSDDDDDVGGVAANGKCGVGGDGDGTVTTKEPVGGMMKNKCGGQSRDGLICPIYSVSMCGRCNLIVECVLYLTLVALEIMRNI